MYQRFDEFREATLSCGADYYNDQSLRHDMLEAAFRIYRNASAGTKLSDFKGNPMNFGITIVGRLARRADDGTWVPADESFPSNDEIMRENLRIIDEDAGDSGSILSADRWSLLSNDAWLLGGIHARTEFHFASPLRWTNLWDAAGGRMTITARELTGIVAFGYTIRRPVPQLEAVAQCVDDQKAKAATLPAYKNEVQKLRTPEAFRIFFETIPSAARQ